MNRLSELVVAVAFWAVTMWSVVVIADCEAWGAEARTVPVEVGVARLQPRLSADAARRWGVAITRAASAHGLDPLLVAALAMRESSFDPDVTEGRRLGRRGEVGVLQIMPGGVAMRFAPGRCSQAQPWCSLATGCAFLAHLRDVACPGSTWRYVAAYGRSTCPSEAEARADPGTRRAHRLYLRAGGERWR